MQIVRFEILGGSIYSLAESSDLKLGLDAEHFVKKMADFGLSTQQADALTAEGRSVAREMLSRMSPGRPMQPQASRSKIFRPFKGLPSAWTSSDNPYLRTLEMRHQPIELICACGD